jgi:hypothetical protein
MKKLLAAALLLTAGLSMSAHASLISGPITFDGSKPVDLQGLEWMPLAYTQGLSRYDVESGFNDSSKAWGAGSWRYATRNETERLLGSLWGGRYDGWSHDNYVGASQFITMFGYTYSNDIQHRGAAFLFGDNGECSVNLNFMCIGNVSTFVNWTDPMQAYDKNFNWTRTSSYIPEQKVMGVFEDEFGVNMGRSPNNAVRGYTSQSMSFGSLLVRSVDTPSATVSSPGALSLFAFGLCGLLLRRRKIAA